MSAIPETNRRIVLASRPHGAPTPENFRLESVPVPEPGERQVLLRTEYLSLDPYMRGRMSDRPSYAPPVALDAVMVGGTVSRVVRSRHDGFAESDLVLGMSGWQEFDVVDADSLTRLTRNMTHPSLALGVLGMPGFTAYMGLLDIGRPQPGETVVVAAATGPVGATVGQIAKIRDCRAVGIAGGPEKCRYAVESFGFDACIDHKSPHFAEALKAAVPDGTDVYFENVGGRVFAAVLPLLNAKARVPICGLISQYSAATHDGPSAAELMGRMLRSRITLQGFIITHDYAHRAEEFRRAMSLWVETGRVKYREDVVDGLERAPEALIGLLEGRNFGKVVVRVHGS